MDASAWDDRYRDRPDPWGAEPAETIRERLADAMPGRAVDLACGDGRHARWLDRAGWTVTAVDYSAVAIEQARGRDPERRIDWQVGDVTEWSPDGPVDLVLLSFLHLPIEQLQAQIARAASWLAPGGRLLYLGHSLENYHRGVGGPPDPAILPTIADLARAADGLRVDALEHVCRTVDAGTAVDILLDARPWGLAPHR
ncbi:class I SAM-dependent methyltransferase [Rhodococcus sp. NPDC127528]|uniref:class I SAM-dependent methyltransferase n=1 Tax=unclassified Rhodococcus (in: high G+C Gram-positive bacteria) TaxID=192944 RepID=UPI00362E3816